MSWDALLKMLGAKQATVRRVSRYLRHPTAECIASESGTADSKAWCFICGEHTRDGFVCMTTQCSICESCLMQERCRYCY